MRLIDAKKMNVNINGGVFNEDELYDCIYLEWVRCQETVDAIPVDFLLQYLDMENEKYEYDTSYAVMGILEDWRKENEID